MPKPLRYLLYTLPAIIIVVLICYWWLDKPIAVMISFNLQDHAEYLSFEYTVFATLVAYCFMLPLFVIYFWLRTKTCSARWFKFLELLCISVPTTFLIKTCLQFLFGRYSPRYDHSTILLFVRNHHLYGFHWFMSGGCFPSGHMAMLSSGLVTITVFYRKMLIPSVILLLLMAIALLGLDYHFLSDIIAGTYLGTTIALGAWWLQNKPA